MKSDRLLSALMLLQGYGRLSTRQLAERLEISQRTAHRDMEALCAAGVPLIAHRGAQGGWELERNWRTQVPGLDAAELQGLLMAQPATLGSSKLAEAAQRAFDKLLAAMPAAAKAHAGSIRARLHFDPSGWHLPDEDLSMLPIVQEALAQDRKLTFFYTRADGQSSTRTVDPLGIVCKQAVWYLVGRGATGMRTFRISRMKDAVVLALACERPAGFDLAAYWGTVTARLAENSQSIRGTLALSPAGVASLRRWSMMTALPDHSARATLGEGWEVYEVELGTPAQARFAVLGLGSNVVALGPETLVHEIADEIARVRSMVDRLPESTMAPRNTLCLPATAD